MSKEKVLVTGGLGFIGSHIVDALVPRGHEVIVLCHTQSCPSNNVNPGATYHFNVDITDPNGIEKFFSQYEPEIVVHNAAQTSRGKSKNDPVGYAKSNYVGSINLIKTAIAHRCQHFVFASSIAVYGKPLCFPVREDHPLLPEDPYGAYKRDTEADLRDYNRWCDLRVTIFRYSNVYGPRQNPTTGVIPLWIDRLLQGQPVQVMGNQMLDVIYIDDVVKANLLAIERCDEGVATYNVGSGKGIRLIDLFERIQEATGIDGSAQYAPESKPDFFCDIGKIKAELGWEPSTSLTQGLEHTVAWLRQTLRVV